MSVSTLTLPDLRSAFRSAASSTWVVTGQSPDGPIGFTAISIISVSLDPALVSFNISKSSSSLSTLSDTRRASLHLLTEEQACLATRFAADRSQRFADDGTWSIDDHGLPRIHDVVTRLTVDIVQLVDAGDSHIVIGLVDVVETTDRTPLVHREGGYTPFATVTTTSNGA